MLAYDMEQVCIHVKNYFKKHLPSYTVLEVRKKSTHPKDNYLWYLLPKKMAHLQCGLVGMKQANH